MKIILIQDVKNLGKKNTIADVSDGYAVNYLFPKKIAVPLDEKNLKKMNDELEIQKKDDEKNFNEAKIIADKLNGNELSFVLKSYNNKVFGQVTQKMIIEKIKDIYDVKIEKQNLLNFSKLQVGKNEIEIRIHKKINVKMIVNIQEE